MCLVFGWENINLFDVCYLKMVIKHYGYKTCYTACDPPMWWERTTTIYSYHKGTLAKLAYLQRLYTVHVNCILCCILLYITAKFNLESIAVDMPPIYYFFDYIYTKDEEEAMRMPNIRDFAIELVSLLVF